MFKVPEQNVVQLPYDKKDKNPFAICFVITPTDHYLIKGDSGRVAEYVKNFPKAVYNMTYWQNGKSRALWRSTLRMYFSPQKLKERFTSKPKHREKIYICGVTADGFRDIENPIDGLRKDWINL